MTGYFNTKELLILGAAGVLIPILFATLFVALVVPDSPQGVVLSEDQITAGLADDDLIRQCQQRIGDITGEPEEALRIDKRSTGTRDGRFNVHGYVTQSDGEYDFQCWFHADRSFDSHYISRVSLKESSVGGSLF